MRALRTFGLIAAVSSALFCTEAPAGAIPPAAGEERAVSSAPDAQGVVGELIGAVAEAGLELRRCSLTGTPVGGEARAELAVTSAGTAEVSRLLEGLRRNHRVVVEAVALKPPGQFDLTLCIDPQEQPKDGPDALGRLAPFDRLPLFDLATPALDGVRLFSCNAGISGARSFQIVAPSLAGLMTFVKAGGKAVPAMSKTLSRTTMSQNAVFTLDLSDDPGFVPAVELMERFERLARIADPREISIQMAPDGSRLRKLLVHAAPARLADLGAAVAADGGTLLKAEVTPLAAPEWALSLLIGTTGAGGPAERPVSPLADVTAALDAPWPAPRRDRLRFSWTPSALQMTASVTDERDVETLKPVAATLGMTYQGAKRQESVETGELTVGFGRSLGTGGPAALVSLDAPLGSFLGFADLLEDTTSRAGRRLVVACPFDQMSRLVEALGPDLGKRLLSLAVDCRPGERCKTTLMLAPEERAEARALLETARVLLAAKLPWNLPESELANGVLVTGLRVDEPERFAILGQTLRSRKIFSDLFPALAAIPGVEEPFFRQGSYTDHKAGRLMKFEVTARRIAR
ncbi:MAG TPA: hypothetical protein PLP29_15940 [Candidatus Ozemobacteraceae bacterium]|nr:hypothetical protein [Candidatus Ozemobacteraceae bacterium]